MSETGKRYTGGCLCGALRYEAQGEPLFAGHCYCTDCQKSSGSGFIPFMGFASSALRITGREPSPSHRRRPMAGMRCAIPAPICSSLVFGGELGKSELLHDLRWLARRPILLPPDRRDLRKQPSALGRHPTGPEGIRPDALRRGAAARLTRRNAPARGRISHTGWRLRRYWHCRRLDGTESDANLIGQAGSPVGRRKRHV